MKTTRNIPKRRICRSCYFAAFILFSVLFLGFSPAVAQQTIEVGKTGFDVKKPVLASACTNGCPWGELGDFVKEAMKPLGYEVILCRNCNADKGPRVVANASYPPELTIADTVVGTTSRVNAPVDFGITESTLLATAYKGTGSYATDGPFKNLRLIAKIEDPYYLLVAVKADSGITDLKQVAEQQMPVKILTGSLAQRILDYYGLTQDKLQSWGGSTANAMITGVLQGAAATFDIIISEMATPANNPESAYWPMFSQKYDLRFLDIPDEILDGYVKEEMGMERVVAKWGLLRGVDRPISTVGRSGEAIFARENTPEQAAYDVAKAVDEHRAALKWYIRPYSYDSRTVLKNYDVPLHPGAKRYYQDMGYINEPSKDGGAPDAQCQCDKEKSNGSGCSVTPGKLTKTSLPLTICVLALLIARRRKKHLTQPPPTAADKTINLTFK